MKKRGDINLWFLVELIGAILIVYLAINISTSRAEGTIYEELNIAKDIAMQINTLASIPGDAYIVNNNLHGYSIKITDDKIEVFEDYSNLVKGTYFFVKTVDSNLNTNLKKPNQVVISKISNKLSISENIPNLT
jgi:hypothetical protein|tara:strand:- start:359 stop:760 length:402 start_codon:yes stop_codon:yes gene_type:complete